MTFLPDLDVAAFAILAMTVAALIYLGWWDRFHHAYLGFFAFSLTAAPIEHIRIAAFVILCDDGLQHIIQAIQWATLSPTLSAKYGNSKGKPIAETPGWPGIARSPLHLLYSWGYGLFA